MRAVEQGEADMAGTGTYRNTEFELRGFNHLALVCRDMAETVAWYEDKLGMKLVKTLRSGERWPVASARVERGDDVRSRGPTQR